LVLSPALRALSRTFRLILTVVLWAWTLVEVALVLALISFALILAFAALLHLGL
jgi:competence protein ComGC